MQSILIRQQTYTRKKLSWFRFTDNSHINILYVKTKLSACQLCSDMWLSKV